MGSRLLFSLVLLLCLHLSATATPLSTALLHGDISVGVLLIDAPSRDFPIFGKKKTSNKKQLKFAAKRSRRNGKGVMKARKRRGANNGRSTKGGQRGKRGSKKKAGCNT